MQNQSIELKVIKTKKQSFINYCFCIINPKCATTVFIDPAWEKDKFTDFLEQQNLELKAIFLTHHHLDHSHLANELAIDFNCPVYISEHEALTYQFTCANLHTINAEQNVLRIPNAINIRLIHTPGHTLGSICYLTNKWLFTGDTLFIEGCGMCSGKAASAKQLFHSLQLIKSLVDPTIQVYPGHRFNYDIGKTFDFVMKNNIYLNIENEADFVKFRDRPNNTKNLSFI